MALRFRLTRRRRRRSFSCLQQARSARRAWRVGSGTIGQRNKAIAETNPARRCPACRFAVIRRQRRDSLGRPMADHSEVAYTTADGNDYVAHEQTYEGFIKLVKYGTGAVIVILILMAIFLV